eukprot:EG_transcript_11026
MDGGQSAAVAGPEPAKRRREEAGPPGDGDGDGDSDQPPAKMAAEGSDAELSEGTEGEEDEDEPEAAEAAEGSGPQRRRGGARKRELVQLSTGRVVNAKKVRNHVNPLSTLYNRPVAVPAEVVAGGWAAVFADPTLPLVLDLGCAKGHYCLEGARRWPALNWLGVEIREPLVVRANRWRREHGLGNLYYVYGNCSAGLAALLQSLPAAALRRVCIQCPDPCFKKRHQKRRMVTGRLAAELREHMPPGAVLFLQSDVEMVAQQLADTFASIGGFVQTEQPEAAEPGSGDVPPPPEPRRRPPGNAYHDARIGDGQWEGKGAAVGPDGRYAWLPANPYHFPSEREACVLARGLPMFRMLFRRAAEPAAAEDPSPAPTPAPVPDSDMSIHATDTEAIPPHQ